MLSLLAVVLAAGSAPAKPLPERAFLVVVPKAGATVPASTETGLRSALEAEKIPLADGSYLFPATVPPSTAPALIADAKKAYDDLDLDLAAKKLGEALAQATAQPGGVESSQLAEIHLLLAAVALQNAGKKGPKLAQEELVKAMAFSPDVQLDAKFFAPDAKKILDKAKTEVLRAGQGKVTASSTPPAEAWVLGRAVGAGTEVLVGRHLVTFKRPGYLQAGVLVDVPKKGAEAVATLTPTPEFAAVLKQAEALVPAGFGGARLPPEARSLAEAVESRFLVLVSADGDAGSLEVWDVTGGNRLKDVAFVGAPGFTAVAQKVKSFMAAPSPVSVAKAEPGAAGAKAGSAAGGSSSEAHGAAAVEQAGHMPVYKQKWFWPAVGGVVAAAAITTGVVMVASAPPAFNPVLSH